MSQAMHIATSATINVRGAQYVITYADGVATEVRRVGIDRSGAEGRRPCKDIERRLRISGPTAKSVIRVAERERIKPAAAFMHIPAQPTTLINDDGETSIYGTPSRAARIVRYGTAHTAELTTSLFTGDSTSTTQTALSAEACEALGRALLDAAHDLRTRPAITRTERAP